MSSPPVTEILVAGHNYSAPLIAGPAGSDFHLVPQKQVYAVPGAVSDSGWAGTKNRIPPVSSRPGAAPPLGQL